MAEDGVPLVAPMPLRLPHTLVAPVPLLRGTTGPGPVVNSEAMFCLALAVIGVPLVSPMPFLLPHRLETPFPLTLPGLAVGEAGEGGVRAVANELGHPRLHMHFPPVDMPLLLPLPRLAGVATGPL